MLSSVMTHVLYHADCPDGFGAAWAAWKLLGTAGVSYVPVQYGRPCPETPGGAEVYILDFSYPKAELIRLVDRSNRVVVLDHHKTAREDLESLGGSVPGLSIAFDMAKSGAMLAWEYFHPGKVPPLLVDYVQDRDLWAWRLPDSKPFSAALSLVPRDFAAWDQLELALDSDLGRMAFIAKGSAILEAKEGYVASLASKASPSEVGGYRVPSVNSPLFQSELGERLCLDNPESPFSAVFFIDGSGDEVWSLRSRGGFDVSEVARRLGGGGHPAAAGFRKARWPTERGEPS